MIFTEIKQILEDDGLLLEVVAENNPGSYNNVVTDSRLVKENDIFVCISGFAVDGHKFAAQADKKGATLLICESKQDLNVNQLIVKNSRKAAALIAKLQYGNPSEKLTIVGITGTNGKTTIVNMLGDLFKTLGYKCGVIGTLGYKIGDDSFETSNTTPDIIELNRILSTMVNQKCEFVFMEVSSHAITLDRIYGVTYTGALFTNLSQDHLDFHATIDDYAATKFSFIDSVLDQGGFALLNIDDKFGIQHHNSAKRIQDRKFGLLSISSKKSDYQISSKYFSVTGSSFFLNKNKIKTKFIGEFNIFNVAAVLALANELIPEKHDIFVHKISEIKPVSGRMQSIPNNRDLGIFVDYAHTPDALNNVLTTLKQISKNRLICVFGAGGNRDKTKRPLMMEAAIQQADITIVTSDNPRHEAPADIIRDIVTNSPAHKFWIVEDRQQAIQKAISLSRAGDVIVIAGKGHETYQEIKGRKNHFDDCEEVKKALEPTPTKRDETNNLLSYNIELLQLEAVFNQKIESKITAINTVSTDSRTIKANSIFFALKGEKYDGHDYANAILKKGNCLVVVNKEFVGHHKNLIKVADTLLAYGDLARSYKQLFPAQTIAITGSMGKTTTKEYLYHILKNSGKILRTHANENNQIGLPKTIFCLCPTHKFAIYELGSNHFGEIEALSKIAEPDIAAITAIGSSHLEFLENRAGVLKEKSAILNYAKEAILIPDDVPELDQESWLNYEEDEPTAYSFGFDEDSDFHLNNIEQQENGYNFELSYEQYFLPTLVPSNLRNATIAICLARLLKIDEDRIKAAISEPLNIPMRMEIKKINDRIILIDCYNANPDSMKAAIQFWNNHEPQRPHVAILGDMLELGVLTEKFHLEICDLVKNVSKNMFVSVGELAELYKADRHFAKVEDILDDNIIDRIPNNACVLLKASHGIQLEKLLKRL